MNSPSIIQLSCSGSVIETVERLAELLNARGFKIFARIDHAEEARAVGLHLPPTVLLIFGNPQSGTPLMIKYPSLALDLPLKALISELQPGKVSLSFNAPEFYQTRYQMDNVPFTGMLSIFEEAARKAT